MLNNMIDIPKGFQTSINLAYDFYDDEKIKKFIPTTSSIEIIEEILLSTVPSCTTRARILIGAYGRGKSHIILVLLSLLNRKEKHLFVNLFKKIQNTNFELFQYLNGFMESNQRLLPVVISGNNSSLTQSFLGGLETALKEHGLTNLMPETHYRAALSVINNWRNDYPKTLERFNYSLKESVEDFEIKLRKYDSEALKFFISIYPSLTSGSNFNPFIGNDVVDIYSSVADKIKDYDYDGLFIVYDEFSKYLESSISDASISDIKLLQDLAEKCNRSGNKQMHLLLISHKDISNYIDAELPKEKIDGWRGVSGRFLHQHLHNNFSQIYEVISQVIRKNKPVWDSFTQANEERFNILASTYSKNNFLGLMGKDETSEIIRGCYPLHPITMFLLPRISEKVAQNERTLFTFLSSEEKYTLNSFLQKDSESFELVTPDYLYDYFEPLLRKEPYNSDAYQVFRLSNLILGKVDNSSLEAKIIKTISLIYIVEQFEKLPPTVDVIVAAFNESVNSTDEIDAALQELIQKKCIVYLRRSDQYLKLKETTGVDVITEVKKRAKKKGSTDNYVEILNQVNLESFIYPNRYNDENEIIRYFDFLFLKSKDFFSISDWDYILHNTYADGIVVGIIPENNIDLRSINEKLKEKSFSNSRLLFVVPNKFRDIESTIYEYQSLIEVREEALEDEALRSECNIYIEDLEEVIRSYIADYIRPEKEKSLFYYKSEKCKISRRAHLTEKLSEICESIYTKTPIFNNELINTNELSTTTRRSRSRIIDAILSIDDDTDFNLNLGNNGQDMAIVRCVLHNTGIIVNQAGRPAIKLETKDVKLNNVIEVIKKFVIEPSKSSDKRFSFLYSKLMDASEGIGMKRAIIPILLSVVFQKTKDQLVILKNNREERINVDLINNIDDDPNAYLVKVEEWSNDKTQYIQGLESIYSTYVIEKEKMYNNFTYLLYAINRWYMSLPRYSKDLKSEYCGVNSENEPQFNELNEGVRGLLSSLKRVDNNPREYLFETLFSVFNFSDFTISILPIIEETKKYIDERLNSLIEKLIDDVKIIFDGENENSSLTSIMEDWYDALSDETKNYLFPNSEDRILETISAITNDEKSFVLNLSKTVTGLSLRDWTDTTIVRFINDVIRFKKVVEDHDIRTTVKDGIAQNTFSISFTDVDGSLVTKTFHQYEASSRANLLKNEIKNSLREMGRAISEHEKRQVLIDIIKELT